MPGFDVEMGNGSVVRIDAEDEDTAMRAAREHGVPVGIKKPTAKKPATTAKRAAPKKSTSKRK